MESALCYHLLLLPLLSSPHLYSSFLCVWADRDSTVASARGKQWENAQGRTLRCKASRTLCVCFCRACLCVLCVWHVHFSDPPQGLRSSTGDKCMLTEVFHIWVCLIPSVLWEERKNRFSQSLHPLCVHEVEYVYVWKTKRECSLSNLCFPIPLPLILTEACTILQCKSIPDSLEAETRSNQEKEGNLTHLPLYPIIPAIHCLSLHDVFSHTWVTYFGISQRCHQLSQYPWHTACVWISVLLLYKMTGFCINFL